MAQVQAILLFAFVAFVCKTRSCVSKTHFRWFDVVGSSWTSPRDGSKFFVAFVRRRRSGQRHQRMSKGHRIQAEDGGDEFHNQEVPQPAGSRRLNPDEALAVARVRVSRLEAALEVLGESDSTEAWTLREALKQARKEQQLKVGRCGSRTRCTSEGGRGTVVDMIMILKDPDPKRPCRQEDFVPRCDEEMQEWMVDGFQKWPGCHIC